MIRLFVGVGFPEDIRLRLAALCAGVPGAKWVESDNFHLSLRFIGEVDEGVADDIHDALAGVRSRRLEISLVGVGHFATSGVVRTLWIGVERNPELMALQARIESAVVRAGLAPEQRRFLPHVTLARLKEGQQNGRISAFLAAHGLFRAGPIPVEHFTLYSSFLRNSGPIYRAEAEYPLTQPAEA
jgi:2'-5' RNA ligase